MLLERYTKMNLIELSGRRFDRNIKDVLEVKLNLR